MNTLVLIYVAQLYYYYFAIVFLYTANDLHLHIALLDRNCIYVYSLMFTATILKMSYLIIFHNENWKGLADIHVDSEIRHLTWSWSREWQSKVKSDEFRQNGHKSSQLAPDKKKDIPNTTVDTQQHITTLKQLKWLPAVAKHWLEVEQQQLLAPQQQQNSSSSSHSNSVSAGI
jgi:hypothetical protein